MISLTPEHTRRGWIATLAALALVAFSALWMRDDTSAQECGPPFRECVASNGLSEAPAPGGLAVVAQGEVSVHLQWNEVPETTRYLVQYRLANANRDFWSRDWATTSASRTINGLKCGSDYHFRVRAFGDGVTTAAAWGAPSAAVTGATRECAAPVFASSSYQFKVARDAGVGELVGVVEATDSPSDTLSYSMAASEPSGVFAIDSDDGRITLAASLERERMSAYTLTLKAGDINGATATTTARVFVEDRRCVNGVTVPNPSAHAETVRECAALFQVASVLGGGAALNWNEETAVTNWIGLTFSPVSMRVEELRLPDMGLAGRVPGALGELVGLSSLDLSGNRLSGEIPSSLGGLSNLRVLDLSDNWLSDAIPTELGRLGGLRDLWLYDNQLGGSIPATLGNATSLRRLYLDDNRLSGEIPAELGALSNLRDVILSYNNLEGPIPPELGNLEGLRRLALHGNLLSGAIPEELGSLRLLESLYLDDNQLTGVIPPQLGGLRYLTSLSISGNLLSGEIPLQLGELPNLTELHLSGGRFTGCVPEALRNVPDSDLGSLGLPFCE